MTTRNRGKEGRDDKLFGNVAMQQKIKAALFDFSFLLGRGYAEKSAKALIGNRYRLNDRQIKAVAGMSASTASIQIRAKKSRASDTLNNQTVYIDGFNVLIILESILSDAYIFRGLDNAYRDLSSVHGSYKRVTQTYEALHLVGDYLNSLNIKQAIWVFDQPVSNSGRLKTILQTIAQEKAYNWTVLLDYNPDKYLVEHQGICISSDAWILEHCQSWFNLIEALFQNKYIESKTIIPPN